MGKSLLCKILFDSRDSLFQSRGYTEDEYQTWPTRVASALS